MVGAWGMRYMHCPRTTAHLPTHVHNLRSACQQVKDPQTEWGIQTHVPELDDKPEANYGIECWAEVNQHHAQTSPSCGKGLCAVHREWRQPWDCTVPVKVCMFKSWGLSLKPCEKWHSCHDNTRKPSWIFFFFIMCASMHVCVCFCVSRSDRKSIRKTKKQTNYLPN